MAILKGQSLSSMSVCARAKATSRHSPSCQDTGTCLAKSSGTPRVNAEVNKALTAPAVVEAFQKGGIASLSGTTGAFADFIQSEITRYAEVIRRAHITAES